MKRHRNWMIAFTAAMLLLAVSCKKKKDDAAPPPPNFSPMTAGSTWTYHPNTGSDYTLTASSKDTTALGRTYKVFTNNNGPNQYMAKSGNDYYRFGTVPGTSGNGFEELYLKDNQNVNATWQTSQLVTVPTIPTPLSATLKYTIKEKGGTRTVGTQNFTGVTHIRLDITVAGFGPVGGGDFYYADGVGMIENSLLVSAAGTVLANRAETLVAYSIK